MTFGEASNLAQQGKKIARSGWNGKGLFVFYVPEQKKQINEVEPFIRNMLFGSNSKMFEGIKNLVRIKPYFMIRNADGSLSTWVPIIGDIFGIDWEVVE
jgi:hypothetical protein